jgi:hypothetical protein
MSHRTYSRSLFHCQGDQLQQRLLIGEARFVLRHFVNFPENTFYGIRCLDDVLTSGGYLKHIAISAQFFFRDAETWG